MSTKNNTIISMEAYFDALLNEADEKVLASTVIDTKNKVGNKSAEVLPFQTEASELDLDIDQQSLQKLLQQVTPKFNHSELKIEDVNINGESIQNKKAVTEVEVVGSKIIEKNVPNQSIALSEKISNSSWKNIKTENQFQVLFFTVSGVTFAVPLTELGGIHRKVKVTSLLCKPKWYLGIMLNKEKKINVVDTIRWIMPNKEVEPMYKFVIMLCDSQWGLSAESLIGIEKINRDDVQWRVKAGERPWLAGMLKEKMCALLHVSELLDLLEKGVDITEIK